MSVRKTRVDKPILGLDFGNTIVDVSGCVQLAGKRFRDFNFEELRNAHPYPDAYDSVRKLSENWFSEVHIVSKCDQESEGNITLWLHIHHFLDGGLIPTNGIHFCREREDKAPICKRLGITHFVDDRVQVLKPMETVPYRYRLGNRNDEPEGFQEIPKGIVHVQNWTELKEEILSTF